MKKIILVGLLVMATSVLANDDKKGIAIDCSNMGCTLVCGGFVNISRIGNIKIEPVADSFKYTIFKHNKYDQILMLDNRTFCEITNSQRQYYYKIKK
ncbi:hypothetical protein [Sulfurimonas sp.]|uniref:hypothetical protein n=1 Tax=Sulfurimonas sp. TaxID=2022749 RepID=UPI002AB1CEEC|nr:hypothetical protein [Sulfurimonas sp.]